MKVDKNAMLDIYNVCVDSMEGKLDGFILRPVMQISDQTIVDICEANHDSIKYGLSETSIGIMLEGQEDDILLAEIPYDEIEWVQMNGFGEC